MADYNEFTIKFARLINQAESIRGRILDQVIFLEYILDLIILKYFCESSSKMELFQATLLNQEYISLESKIKTFKNLDLGMKGKYSTKALAKELQKAREERNYFAHRMIDNSTEAIQDGRLRLVYYQGGKKKFQQIDEKYLQEKLKWLKDLRTTLAVLFTNANFSRSSDIDISVG